MDAGQRYNHYLKALFYLKGGYILTLGGSARPFSLVRFFVVNISYSAQCTENRTKYKHNQITCFNGNY